MKLTMFSRTMGGVALTLAVWALSGCSSDDKTTAPGKLDPVDEIAPLAPTGLAARESRNGFGAGWEANVEADLRGYHVYVLGADAVAPQTWVRVTKDPVTDRGFSWKDPSERMTEFAVRVSAVDEAGNESVWSSPAVAQTVSTPKGGVEIDPDADGGLGGSGGSGGGDGSHEGEPVDHDLR
jgi:hypothetical protein